MRLNIFSRIKRTAGLRSIGTPWVIEKDKFDELHYPHLVEAYRNW
jgi:hypothetical protein